MLAFGYLVDAAAAVYLFKRWRKRKNVWLVVARGVYESRNGAEIRFMSGATCKLPAGCAADFPKGTPIAVKVNLKGGYSVETLGPSAFGPINCS